MFRCNNPGQKLLERLLRFGSRLQGRYLSEGRVRLLTGKQPPDPLPQFSVTFLWRKQRFPLAKQRNSANVDAWSRIVSILVGPGRSHPPTTCRFKIWFTRSSASRRNTSLFFRRFLASQNTWSHRN